MAGPPPLRTPTSPGEAGVLVRGAEFAARAWKAAPSVVASVRGRYLVQQARRRLAATPAPYRLCLGSGRAPIPGWTNVDYYFPADVQLDLRFGIPVPDGSVELIYSEHLIEHLPLEANLRLFAECRRVLSPDGRMRIATPDLEAVVRDYRTDWRRHDWVNWDEFSWIDSGTRMVNVAVREWGHVYMWDFDELSARLTQVGFADVARYAVGESDRESLSGLETRADSLLVVEAGRGEGSR